MKAGAFLYTSLLAAAVAQAFATPEDWGKYHSRATSLAQTPDATRRMLMSVGHDQVRPFPQPVARTISEKAAVKFKPQLHVINGCHSYPMVDAAGETSGGLKASGRPDGKCKGSGYGSQVYGRAAWYGDIFAIAYVWYFPKNSPRPNGGYTHDVQNVIVWIDNPENKNSTILAVSVADRETYPEKFVPPGPAFKDGTSVKLSYGGELTCTLSLTAMRGEFQPLIMWHQLSEPARKTLNHLQWGGMKIPISDGTFKERLALAYPFPKKKR